MLTQQSLPKKRVEGASGKQTLVDDPGVRLDVRAPQVFLQGIGLRHRSGFCQGDQQDTRISVSPIQFRHGDLPGLVHSVLLETGLAPGRLELEITEGVLIDDFSRAVSILRRLKLLGVQIALDDFGTGYSSLSYLHAFPFDKIKIDRTFISDLENNRHSIAIVRAVIGLSRSLNIPILAEGVETEAQHAFLAKEGCDEVQGYLTGRPLEIFEYAGLMGKGTVGIYSHASS